MLPLLMLLLLPACCGVRLRENSGDPRETPFGRERALKRKKQNRKKKILKTKSKVENHVFLGALFKWRFLFTLLLLPPGRNGNRESAAHCGCAIDFVVFIIFA